MQGEIWNSRTQELKNSRTQELKNSGKREEDGDSPPRKLTDWATGLKTVELLAGYKTEALLRHQADETGSWVERMACTLKPA
jgi:hypothetical protein